MKMHRFLEALLPSTAVAAMLVTSPAAAASAALPPALTLDQFLEFCRSTTVAEAKIKGDALGWRPMGHADSASEWRERFLDVNGGALGAVTWRRGEDDGDGILSFWIAAGESIHRACSLSTSTPDGILDSLKQAFGKPSYFSGHKYGEVVFWTHGSREVSFSRMNSSVGVMIVYKE